MPELRRDALTGRWVILSEERAGRPDEYAVRRARGPATAVDCPFCEGRESETTPEVLAVRPAGSRADGPGWLLRVVTNRFPALRPDATGAGAADGLPGFGAHEVVIETPRHVVSLSEMSQAEARGMLAAWRARLRALALDPGLAVASVFKNVGGEAGASIEHAHSQILALPVVPPSLREELDLARARGSCAGCEAVGARGPRAVAEGPRFVAEVPWAARMPFEVRILPRRHASAFEAAEDGELDELAGLLRDVAGRIERAAGGPAYNVVLQSAPLRTGPLERFHWRVEILPRTTGLGGFEWGTGVHINPTAPEAAARLLREAGA
jgi:UDPglucose--hexose-1-phosphate uridylyltransferase